MSFFSGWESGVPFGGLRHGIFKKSRKFAEEEKIQYYNRFGSRSGLPCWNFAGGIQLI